MKDPLSGIVSMLESGSVEQQIAAAQVFAWLHPRTPSVVKALGHCASSADAIVRPYAVDALAAIGNAASIGFLIPILHVEGPLRSKVARALGALGAEAEKVLVKEFDKADHDTRMVILEILARMRGAEAMKLLFAVLKDPELQNLTEATIKPLREAVAELDAESEEAVKLRKTLLANLKRIPKKAPGSYEVALLELLNLVKDASCRAIFLGRAGSSNEPEQRCAALKGLVGMELTPAQTTKLLGYLDESDFIHIVGPTLEVLEGMEPSGAQMATAFGKLLQNPRPEVRLFALRGLGNYQTATSAKLLLPFLESEDERVHSLASEGLGSNPEAREALVKMLLAARDLEEAGRPIDALVKIADQLTPGQVKKLVQRFQKLLAADDPVRELVQRVLAAASPDVITPLIRDESHKLRLKQDYRQALVSLQTLAGEEPMHAEVRYELAITTLLMRGSEPDLTEGDPVIGHLCHLVRDGFPLLQKIKREKQLGTDDVLYLGNRFVERLNEERRFGSDLLAWLIDKEPEAKESIQAMQKLKVEGLA